MRILCLLDSLGTAPPSSRLHAEWKVNKVADALAHRLQSEGHLGVGKKPYS